MPSKPVRKFATTTNYGYERGYDSGYGDMTLCDGDCGWCGHCFEGVDIDSVYSTDKPKKKLYGPGRWTK
jgi:hypothetical protein